MSEIPESKRRCVFCGGGPMTREDVWPVWLLELMEQRLTTTEVVVSRDGVERTAPNLKTRVRQVCKSCNNGWMSLLEAETKPILSPMIMGDGVFTLSEREVKILARWAMKTYLMIDLIFPSHRRVIPPFAYPGFRRYGTPPKQCVVWIAAYGGNKPSFTIHSGSAAEVAPAVFNNDGVVISGRTGPIGARCTFSVYRVVFQVIIMNTPLPLRGATDHIGAQKIWPLPRGPVQWPVGNMAFDDDVLLSFANRHIDVFIPR